MVALHTTILRVWWHSVSPEPDSFPAEPMEIRGSCLVVSHLCNLCALCPAGGKLKPTCWSQRENPLAASRLRSLFFPAQSGKKRALQYIKILARREDLPESGWVVKNQCGKIKADRNRQRNERQGNGTRFFSLHSSADHSSAFTSGRVGLRLSRVVFFAAIVFGFWVAALPLWVDPWLK
jgi:hypothetical protein